MSDLSIEQAIDELRDLVRCRCHPGFKDRGLRDPSCDCDSAEAVEVLVRALPAVQPDAAAIREAARMLDDIVCGRGMFGIDPAQDLQWAMETAGAARALIDKPATKGGAA